MKYPIQDEIIEIMTSVSPDNSYITFDNVLVWYENGEQMVKMLHPNTTKSLLKKGIIDFADSCYRMIKSYYSEKLSQP